MTSQCLHGDLMPVKGPLGPRRGWREGCWLPVGSLGPDVGEDAPFGAGRSRRAPGLGWAHLG